MHSISLRPILVFMLLTACVLTLTISTAHVLHLYALHSELLYIFLFVIILYLYLFLFYRIFLAVFPLPLHVDLNPDQQRFFDLYLLFFLIFFRPLILMSSLPPPLTRLIYQALGAKLGKGTYIAGCLLDPPLVQFGRDCIVGHNAVLYAHAIEGKYVSFRPITAGNNVTIGAHAIIMGGVTIGDHVIIAAGSVIPKGTQIGSHETWGGVPAKRLK